MLLLLTITNNSILFCRGGKAFQCQKAVDNYCCWLQNYLLTKTAKKRRRGLVPDIAYSLVFMNKLACTRW